MGSKPDYVRKKFAPLQKKTLQNALAQRIAQEFPRIGGPRIRELCAEMILEVVRQHVRSPEQICHGQVLWMAVPVRLDRKPAGERLKQKAIRLCQQAYEQGGLLSNCDLAELLSTGDSHISHLLADHERVTGQLIPRRATLHDVGTGLTHKRIICRKRFAEGKEPHVVAKETYHSLEAVDRYLGQYDRVRHCRLQGMTPEETAYTLNCSLSLVREYLDIDHELEQLHG